MLAEVVDAFKDLVSLSVLAPWTRLKTLLASLFLLLPFHQPLTTPSLSPWTTKCPGLAPKAMMLWTRNSKPTASAHRIWRCLDSQPGMRRHARHREPMTTAIPIPELAS